MRIIGSRAYSFIPKEKRGKLEPRSRASYFVGYGGGGYRLWDGKKIYIVRDVVVEEQVLKPRSIGEEDEKEMEPDTKMDRFQLLGPFCQTPPDGVEPGPGSQPEPRPQPMPRLQPVPGPQSDDSFDDEFAEAEDESFDQLNPHEAVPETTDGSAGNELRRSNRLRHPPIKLSDYLCIAYALNAESFVEEVSGTIEELQKLEDWSEWKKAIDQEMTSLAENDTWQLADLPAGCKPVDCKWVFRLKLAPDGFIQKRKARLVAKEFTQRYGFDYSETYAPVVRMATVRSMIALANQHGFAVYQMDVTSTFLNGVLTEDIYMRQPKGFEEGDKVCKLNKSLYGLRQASKTWNDRFDEFVGRCGFRRCEGDNCLYVRESKSGTVFLLLYVDDVLLIAKDVNEIKAVKRLLRKEFKMQDLGDARMFLNMQIEYDQAA